MSFEAAELKLSVRLVERNDALDIAAPIQNANLACAKARAILCVIDRLILLRENRLDAANSK